MKSSLKNMVLVLLSITFVSAAILGLVYDLTKGPIEESKRSKTTTALSKVLPQFDNDPSKDTINFDLEGFRMTVYIASKGGKSVGYAVETATGQGFSGLIKMLVGFEADGKVRSIEVLEHNETPGLGSKMADPDNVLLLSFKGKDPGQMDIRVKKDGGDVDVITASTISSRAYSDAVGRAYRAFRAVAFGGDVETEPEIDPAEAVLPPYDLLPDEGMQRVAVEGGRVTAYRAYLEGVLVGYAIETYTKEAFRGEIKMMVGFDTEGTVTGIYVMEQEETPGFGAAITEADNALVKSFVGRKLPELNMKLAPEGGDVDGITGSTITSEAYIDAMKRAGEAFDIIAKEDRK